MGNLALGSDLDGISGKIEVDEPEKLEVLFAALDRAGFREEEIERIAMGNALRMIRDVLR